MVPKTVPEALDDIFSSYKDQPAFVHKQPFYRQVWTYGQTQARIWQMVALLQSKDLRKGDKVAICGPNSPWWLVTYLACAVQGIVVVPLDFNSSSEFMDKVLVETDAKLLLKSVYKIYAGTVETLLLEDLLHILPPEPKEALGLPDLSTGDSLEIVFTSGSTGTPKGVVLTHGNVMHNVANFLAAWPPQKHQISLSLVPLSHMLEQTAGFWAPFRLGYTIVYIASLRPTEIARALREERITCIITVPAFLQLLRRRIGAQAGRSVLARLLLKTAHMLPRPAARLITWPIRRHMGSHLESLAVGGAALPIDVENFWTDLGFYVIQGYGLTETSPLATYSSKRQRRPRSVGKSLPNQQIKIADNGELLLRGPHVFKGYYKNKRATNQVVDADGWLHTGDIAEIDSDGFVFLKGRLKNMLLGSNGLNIYPEDIEAKILNYSDIRDVVVLMDNHGEDPKLTAVVLTNCDDAYVHQILQEVNQTLASHQIVQNHIIWPDTDFPRTPTRKVRRPLVQEAVDNRKTDEPFIPSQDASQVQSVLRQVSGATKPINGNMVIVSDLAIDSIKRLELVTLLEEKLLVAIDETMITPTTTVKQLEQLVDAARQTNDKGNAKPDRGLTQNELLLTIQSASQALLLWLVGRYQQLRLSGGQLSDGPVIYVANHTSHLDAVTFLRAAGFRGRQRIAIAAAADYFFANPLRSWLSRNLVHAVPIQREGSVRESLERLGRELSYGRSVVVFPEGSRSPTGKIQSFKPGIGLLAASLQVPVVPVKLDGNFELLPKGARWPKHGVTHMRVGDPRTYSVARTPDEITKDLQRAVEEL